MFDLRPQHAKHSVDVGIFVLMVQLEVLVHVIVLLDD